MVDRDRVWLGAGLLAGGVSAATLAGAGVAAADDGTSSGTEASAGDGSQDTSPHDRPDRQTGSSSSMSEGEDRGLGSDPDVETPRHKEDPDQEARPNPEYSVANPKLESSLLDEVDDVVARARDSSVPVGGRHRAPELVVDPAVEYMNLAPDSAATDADPHLESDVTEDPAITPRFDEADSVPSTFLDNVDIDLGSTHGAVVMRLAAAEVPVIASSKPTLLDFLNDIGTAIYDFYTGAVRLLGGPVRVPFGSSARVESSELDLGGGRSVPADWYFPPGAHPTGLIYLQHGLWATASFYSATAAYLAEKTNSIVVAPTLTWNPFDIANYPLQSSATGRAVAELFIGDRSALHASARTAGYGGPFPEKFLLAGHSAGGGLVVTAAGVLSAMNKAGNLTGVVMLDGVRNSWSMSRDLATIPHSIPVYNLAAAPNGWNYGGDANRRLAQVRPGMFTGVVIRSGKHSDAMQSASSGLQFLTYSVIGLSSSLNVVATRMIAAGWINDLFADARTAGLYSNNTTMLALLTGRWQGHLG